MAGKADYTDEFERFWKKYPRRWNKDFQGGTYIKRKKRPAFIKWQKLSQAIRNECLAKVQHIYQAEGGTVRDCVTWLNQYGWEDIEIEIPASIVTKTQADKLLKPVPQGDTRSISDRANEQRKALNNGKG